MVSKTVAAKAHSPRIASSTSLAIPVARTWTSCSANVAVSVTVSPVMLRSGPVSGSGENASNAFPNALAWAGMTMPTSGI